MGALTSNRKRGDDCFKIYSFLPQFHLSNDHISKKTKLSSVSMNQNTPLKTRPAASNSFASRIAQYPDKKPSVLREVHAPVRNRRLGSFSSASESSASSKDTSADKMGRFSFFCQKLVSASNLAFGSFRSGVLGKQKEKEIIELDSESEDRDDVSSGSSIEEVEIGDFNGRRLKGREDEPNVRTSEKEVRSLDSSVVTDVSNAVAKVEDMEKNGSSLLADDSGLLPYKRLHNSVNKRDGKLFNLYYDIEIEKKRYQRIQSSRPPKKEESKKDVSVECFVPLNDEEKTEISRAFSNSHRRKCLVSHAPSGIDITGEILQCLRPGAWLNDEVINVYVELLKEREKREPQRFLKCHFFNTFFYKKLVSGQGGYNFQSVRRWTSQKKLGYSLFECDKIFVPIHKEIHWCLAVINKKDQKFQYLDSLGGADKQVLNALAKYFVDEVKDKCGKDIDVNSWDKEFVRELPAQENGFDCGMFMIKYADFYSRDIGLCFSQENMPYFRQRTAKEILRLRAE